MYDPETDAWTEKSSYPGGQAIFPSGFVIGDHIYVGTGSPGGFAGSTGFYRYTPATDTWVKKADFPVARQAGVGFSIGATGYIGGGQENYSTTFNTFYSYNIWTDTWTLESDLERKADDAVAWSTACVYNNTVFMGTGADFNGGNLNYSDDFYKIEVEPLSVREKGRIELNVYPNPATDMVHIRTNGLSDYQNVTIINTMGQTVLTASGSPTILDVSQLQSGLYQIVLFGPEGSTVVPLMLDK